jgi:hypothetical protein
MSIEEEEALEGDATEEGEEVTTEGESSSGEE